MGNQVVSIMDHEIPLIQLEAHQKPIVYHPFLHSVKFLDSSTYHYLMMIY